MFVAGLNCTPPQELLQLEARGCCFQHTKLQGIFLFHVYDGSNARLNSSSHDSKAITLLLTHVHLQVMLFQWSDMILDFPCRSSRTKPEVCGLLLCQEVMPIT